MRTADLRRAGVILVFLGGMLWGRYPDVPNTSWWAPTLALGMAVMVLTGNAILDKAVRRGYEADQ